MPLPQTKNVFVLACWLKDSFPTFEGFRTAKMKVALFGSTGGTGRLVLNKLIEKGHSVTAIVRSPEKFSIELDNLEVVKGDATNVESFKQFLEGKDAVVSCLGAHGTSVFKKTNFYTTTMEALSNGMTSAGIKKLVCITSWFTERTAEDPFVVGWFMRPIVMAGFIDDMRAMEKFLLSTELDYTIVRPPGLNNNHEIGNYAVEVERTFLKDATWFMPRADVAQFTVRALETDEFNRKAAAIGITK